MIAVSRLGYMVVPGGLVVCVFWWVVEVMLFREVMIIKLLEERATRARCRRIGRRRVLLLTPEMGCLDSMLVIHDSLVCVVEDGRSLDAV